MELFMTRTILSIAIVDMVQVVNAETTLNASSSQPYCLQHRNASIDFSGLNATNEDTMMKILGGRSAEKYGTKLIMCTSVLVDILGNLLIPISSKSSYIFVIIIRFVMGFFQGMCYPSVYVLLSKWVPVSESSRFLSSVFLVGGIIVNDYGYEMAFYVCALLGLIWLLFWVLLMYDYPETHPRISEKERNYILENRAKSKSGKKNVPWLKIFISLHVWAISIAHAGAMFGFSFMITQLPLYLSSVIGLNIKANGFLSSLPYLTRFIGSNSISWLTTYLERRTKWTKKTWFRICSFLSR
ncbi:Sialin [Armadillidium nasatum]|uniref:Sialin n=1 Tax=Armadillidium nasatum TaxID=96803 RepID=A0A5N5SPM1_9CRUS|nr:Sialin [Armadillidium nasatum]